VVAIALALSVISAGVILGQRVGPFSRAGQKKTSEPQAKSGITPASFDAANPSKEYIYSGSSLLATEEAPATGCSPSITPSSTSYPASGGTGSVGVSPGSGCSWMAVS